MIDQLAQEDSNRPVVFLEYYAPTAPYSRYGRFWAAYNRSYATYPNVIADSGHQVSSGPVDYYHVYKSMVDAELSRPARAAIQAAWQRDGDKARFTIQLTNQSGGSLSLSNGATVHAIVYEDAHAGVTGRYVRSAVATAITPQLADGATSTFTLETGDLTGVTWDHLHYLALADYRPGGSTGAYDMLQAAWALP